MMKSSLALLFIATAATVTAATVTSVPARAEAEYAWCAFGASQGGSQSCTFATLAQCKAYVDGPGGYCQSNPRASAFAEMPKRIQRR
jgi:hypothetical protein